MKHQLILWLAQNAFWCSLSIANSMLAAVELPGSLHDDGR